jgi:diguanylate cyclase (GGDEF)-like protein
MPLGHAPAAPPADSQFEPSLRSQTPESDEALSLQCVLDTADRSATGIFIYPAIWLTVVLATGLSTRWPWFAWGNVLGMLMLALFRTAYHPCLPGLLHSHRRKAEAVFNASVLLNSAYWGSLTALCMHWAPGESISWIMMVTTIGFCAGGNTLFGINPALRLAYPLMMVAPLVAAEVAAPTPDHLMMLVLELVFAVYLTRSSKLVHADYWGGRHAQRVSDERARELERASLTDGLTQVANRIHFDRQFAYEWARHHRRASPLSLLVVDLDHFKNINDSFGHPFGDTCLQAVAQALRAGCGRSTDFVARYGGEEFVILLADTDAHGAQVIAERMLQNVRNVAMSADGLTVQVTCSIGLATTIPTGDQRPAALIDRADSALYQAKHSGRNRTVVSQPYQ